MTPEKRQELRSEILRAMRRTGKPLRAREIAEYLRSIGWENCSTNLVVAQLGAMHRGSIVKRRFLTWGKVVFNAPGHKVLEHGHWFWLLADSKTKEFWFLKRQLMGNALALPRVQPVAPRTDDMRAMIENISATVEKDRLTHINCST